MSIQNTSITTEAKFQCSKSEKSIMIDPIVFEREYSRDFGLIFSTCNIKYAMTMMSTPIVPTTSAKVIMIVV